MVGCTFAFNVDSVIGLTKAMFELVSKKMDVPGDGMDDHTSIYTSLSTSSSSLKHSLSSIDIIQPKFMVIDSLHRAPSPQTRQYLALWAKEAPYSCMFHEKSTFTYLNHPSFLHIFTNNNTLRYPQSGIE